MKSELVVVVAAENEQNRPIAFKYKEYDFYYFYYWHLHNNEHGYGSGQGIGRNKDGYFLVDYFYEDGCFPEEVAEINGPEETLMDILNNASVGMISQLAPVIKKVAEIESLQDFPRPEEAVRSS